MKNRTATFAAGCFWQVEALFRKQQGVTSTRVGYTGGHADNPSYEQVCTSTTGHAEAVEITYDPDKIDYTRLLQLFWDNHNPTSLNRQGRDVGSQYRSVIFYHNEQQKQLAVSLKQDLETTGKHTNPIVTEIIPATTFFPAEDHHQQYLEKRGLVSCDISKKAPKA